MLRSDILDRAAPSTFLILRRSHLPDDLNLSIRSRLSALAAWSGLAFLAFGFWFPGVWIGVFLCLAILGVTNADLYRFFARRGGLTFALGAAGLHTFYLLYSSLAFGLAVAWVRLTGDPASPPRARRI